MKIRFPLYAKILVYFLGNLVFLGVVFYAVFLFQFRSGLDSLLLAQASERVQSAGQVLSGELNETPGTNWNRVLQRFSEAYGAQFFLFGNNGVQSGGDPVGLPAEVMAKIKEPRGLGMGRRGPPAGRGPNRFLSSTNSGLPPGWGMNRSEALQTGEPLSKFLIHSKNPGGYWIGICLPGLNNPAAGLSPMVLLAKSDSLRGGLFPDLTLWLWVGLGAVLCSALFWLPLVHGITKFIGQMTQATEQIAEGHFETRVKTERNDELGRLGYVINRMSARLAGFVTGQRRFMGDIAHELCSPLARMQVAVSTLDEQIASPQKSGLADIQEDLQQMSGLINELLSFSKAALQPKNVELKPVPLAAIVRRVLDREQTNANNLKLEINESLQVLAEPELLSRALSNLIRNATRYAGSAGPILVSATPMPKTGTIVIIVADSGPGVPKECLEQIFDPFYRVETSRSRATGGAGLGLAIVKTCVEACQGKVVARNRVPAGLEVEIVLHEAEPPSQL